MQRNPTSERLQRLIDQTKLALARFRRSNALNMSPCTYRAAAERLIPELFRAREEYGRPLAFPRTDNGELNPEYLTWLTKVKGWLLDCVVSYLAHPHTAGRAHSASAGLQSLALALHEGQAPPATGKGRLLTPTFEQSLRWKMDRLLDIEIEEAVIRLGRRAPSIERQWAAHSGAKAAITSVTVSREAEYSGGDQYSERDAAVFKAIGKKAFLHLTNGEIGGRYRSRLIDKDLLLEGNALKCCLDRIRRHHHLPLSSEVKKIV